MRCSSARIAPAALLAALVLLAAPGLALQQLHVTELSVRADRTRVRIGEQFHLVVHAHVRESVERLDGIVLPDLTEVDFLTLADERQYAASARGTDYIETLTLVARREGTFAIGPVTFDVIDSLTRHPVRNASTSKIVIVVGPVAPLDPWLAVRDFVYALLRAALIGAAAIAAIALLVFWNSRRKRAPVPLVSAPLAPLEPVTPPPPMVDLHTLLARLRAEHDRASAQAARAYLWQRAAVPEGATLSQALSMNGSLDPALRGALVAAERAAFIEPDRMHTAIDDLIERMERLI